MDKFHAKSTKNPETLITEAIVKKLRGYGWDTFKTHGNAYQHGFPDLYCIHPKYGTRWVEVKNPKGHSFTPAQMETFPRFSSCKVGIWVLTGDEDSEIDKLFGPANWWAYMGVMK
jgi:hypothetical protein